MNSEPDSHEKYSSAKSERQKQIDKILEPGETQKKIVVAGPGTGKTYLFKEVLKGKTKTLTLTFINALVEDLSLELCGLSEVRTLHGFARQALGRIRNIKDIKVFRKLSDVITKDAEILLGKKIDFNSLFHNRDDENPDISFYKRRKDYYGHYGFADIVFAVVKCLEGSQDKIPTYQQILVDEFQDFNKLEVSLIDQLAKKSPILLVGDDDQALYEFKHAKTDYIRERRRDVKFEYEPFDLSYCSRCTRVIVAATKDVISKAKECSNLKDRIEKPYEYFDSKAKDKESTENPRIVHATCFSKQTPWFIAKQICEVARERKHRFTVLIISPLNLQCRAIVKGLREYGLKIIESGEKQKDATVLDGLKILLDEKNNNLGWRIVAERLLSKEDFSSALKQTSDESKDLLTILDPALKKQVREMLTILRAIRDGKETDKGELGKLLEELGLDPYRTITDRLKDEIKPNSYLPDSASIRTIPITTTTIQRSKGLAADYVFITHFDDRYFIKHSNKEKISDLDISNFLVAMTRAKTKLFLVSSNAEKKPTFLQWINKDRIEDVACPTP